jgi:epoxyqueuosine reductase
LPEFEPRAFPAPATSTFLPDLLKLARLTREEFREIFRGSPVKRTKWQGLVRNACIALGNARLARENPAYSEVLRALEELRDSAEPAVAESARWALSRIQPRGGAREGRDPASTGVP